MPRMTIALLALVAVLGAAVGYLLVRPAPTTITETEVRGIVSAALASERQPVTGEAVEQLIAAALAEQESARQQSHAPIDAVTFNGMVEDYLLENPRILQRVAAALEREIRLAETERSRAALASLHAEVYEDPDHIVLGNPEGDVTLVELFDYNCGFCRQSLPDLVALMEEDANLKVVLKEMPVLGDESEAAARIALAVHATGGDYWSFHKALFTSRGRVDAQTALATAEALGHDGLALMQHAESAETTAALERNEALARALGVTGTPSYILGDEVIAGAVGLDQLRLRIANLRDCGSTICEETEQTAATPGADG